MRISDWSSDVCSSDLVYGSNKQMPFSVEDRVDHPISLYAATKKADELMSETYAHLYRLPLTGLRFFTVYGPWGRPDMAMWLFRSEEHTSELQSLMRISYAVFCLKKKKTLKPINTLHMQL